MTDGELRLLGALLAVRNAAVRVLVAPTDKRRDELLTAIEEADAALEEEARRRRLGLADAPVDLPPPAPAPTRLAFPAQQTPPQGSRMTTPPRHGPSGTRRRS